MTNDFIPFGNSASELESLPDYATDAPAGNIPGIASAAFVNRSLRQANAIGSAVARYLALVNGTDVLDNAVDAQMTGVMNAALMFLAPIQTTTQGPASGTLAVPQWVFCASASATAGATYTDGASHTFTVVNTVSGKAQILFSGAVLMAVGAGALTLTKASGTGDATITYFAVRFPQYLDIEALGGGGGGGNAISTSGNGSIGQGGGGGAYARVRLLFTTSLTYAVGGGGAGQGAFGSAGDAGGDTTINSTLVVAGGGSGGLGMATGATAFQFNGVSGSAAASGGDINVPGGRSTSGFVSASAGPAISGAGGTSPYSSGGFAQTRNPTGGTLTGVNATGNGGGGGGGLNTNGSGTGTAAGGNGSPGLLVFTVVWQ